MLVKSVLSGEGNDNGKITLTGRRVIYTDATVITPENVVIELGKALAIHNINRAEIEYLDRVYRGNHDINKRVKKIRPEINNKIVVNIPYQIVEFFTGMDSAEPLQYVRRADADESVSKDIIVLNRLMATENKGAIDIDRTRWQHICGTSYMYVFVDNMYDEYDEAPYGLESLDPRDNFVVYNSGDGKKPLFTVSKRRTSIGNTKYVIFTRDARYEIPGDDDFEKITLTGYETEQISEFINKIDVSVNGIGMLPIIEFPNNERRLSTIEVVLDLCDAIDKLESDRLNAVEQFVQSLMVAYNCNITDKQYDNMRQKGLVVLKSNGGTVTPKIELLDSELNQTVTQTLKEDYYEEIMYILGMPTGEQNTGGDTGEAVFRRNGWYNSEQRALLREPLRKASENQLLKIIFKILKSNNILNLKSSDIEIKITRSKTDNMSVKANVLVLLLKAGIDYQTAVKTCELWSDPEEVTIKSKDNFVRIYEENDGDLNKGTNLEAIPI